MPRRSHYTWLQIGRVDFAKMHKIKHKLITRREGKIYICQLNWNRENRKTRSRKVTWFAFRPSVIRVCLTYVLSLSVRAYFMSCHVNDAMRCQNMYVHNFAITIITQANLRANNLQHSYSHFVRIVLTGSEHHRRYTICNSNLYKHKSIWERVEQICAPHPGTE